MSSSEIVDNKINLSVIIFDSENITRIAEEINSINGTIINSYDPLLKVEIPEYKIYEIATINGVYWIENYSDPVLFNDVAAEIMNVEPVHSNLKLNGSGQIVAVCDTGLDTGVNESIHEDIRGRVVDIIDYSGDGAEDYAGHGTHVVGSILGDGTLSSGQYKGIAPEASLVFQAVQKNTDSTDKMSGIPSLEVLFQDAYNLGANIHSDSWGDPSNIGGYTEWSQQVDQFMWDHPEMLIIFAAGNEGVDVDRDGVIDKNSITSPATAKNCITVGASENERDIITYVWGTSYGSPISMDYQTDNSSGLAAFSSRGPTDDNRIKPDLVAPGTFVASTRSSLATMFDYGITNTNYAYLSGTSMSTPLVSGSAALVREYYTEVEQLNSPSAALIKATLINGAYDMTPGQYGTENNNDEISGRPDYSQGWGRVDVENSILVEYPEVIAYFDNVALSDSKSWIHEYDYIESGLSARATLVWTDYPSSLPSSKALYNDLDLVISSSSNLYYGNGGQDHINNVEGVEIETTSDENYTITVDGYDVQEGPQPFALVFSFTCDNNEFPANGSYAPSSITGVSTDVVHPGGVDENFIEMKIDENPVTSFTSNTITDGYRIEYDTSDAYQAGGHNVSITASTVSGQQFSYEWEFNVLPEITSFEFSDLSVAGTIDGDAKTITATVPYGTDVTDLVPTIIHTGSSISPGSGISQDFSSPVVYTVTAADGTSQDYTVTVTVALNPAKEITSFEFSDLSVTGTIDADTKTITATVPYGTVVSDLVPSIVHTGSSISPISGVSQDFTESVVYNVTAADGTSQEYTVTVNMALNPSKSITSFEFSDLSVIGTIDADIKTITATVPYGTDVTDLVPTIVHTGSSISPSSGVSQDFTESVVYNVTAADGTSQEYTVTVNIALNPSKSITSFEFTDLSVTGTIDADIKTITVTVPYGTDVTDLVPTIVHTGSSISSGSGVSDDFSSPVVYTVTAADGTSQDYTVTVTVALNPAKSITSFEFTDPVAIGHINETEKTVTMTVPNGTDVTALVPSIIHAGSSISPDSGVSQDFTESVVYNVTAADGTSQEYTVTVTIAPANAKEITSFKFTDPTAEGVINETAKAITLTVPYGTNVTALVPIIEYTGQSLFPEAGISQNFTESVVYNVTAVDGTSQEYVVTVEVANQIITTTSTSTSSGGGGGGGGGGTTGEEFENIAVKDASSVFVGTGNVNFEFYRDGNDIQYVSYDSLKNSGTISVTIEVLNDKSTFVSSLPAGEIYKNINIWVGKVGYATENNIANPVIGFKVPRSWIEENNIDEGSIVLERYDGGWSRLSTTQTGSDDEYLYFEASTQGFSSFVIMGESMVIESSLNSVDSQFSTADEELESNITAEDSEPENTLNALSGLISCLILSLVCFLYRKQ
ncbi:PGF-pre-PGF domain-containing protein [Methanolobus vulcani]|uniref:PGF-pre-PGF domain-containing protein n=1 Tax=Methanolobus vulcani TaxID=38026 RepID=UPI0018ACCFFD|nr:PGF-pre-PGF domain-containing protein [Methanolobus vulcani]